MGKESKCKLLIRLFAFAYKTWTPGGLWGTYDPGITFGGSSGMPRRTKTSTCGAFEWQVSVSVLLGFTLSQSCIVFWPAPFLKCLQRSIWMLRKPTGRGTGRARNLLYRIWFLWIDEVGQACLLVSSCHLGFRFSSGWPGRIRFSSSWPGGISSYSSWPGGICISCWQGRVCIVLWLFNSLFCVWHSRLAQMPTTLPQLWFLTIFRRSSMGCP